ncbi:hypothetical protein P3W45_000329 [Vairimorpha bombi]|jgi:small-conductance mechanosensitive channel
MSDNFNWFENDVDAEIEEFEQKESVQTTFSKIFDYICSKINVVFIFLLVTRIIWFLFSIPSVDIFHVDFLVILVSLLVITGSFSAIVAVTKILTYIFLNIGLDSKFEALLGAYRLLAIIVWCLVNLSWFKAIKSDIINQYYMIRAILSSILITAIAYNLTSVLMIIFDKYFVTKTLNSKLNDVERTEKILSLMKDYRYEISTTSTMGTPECPCKDIFCFDIQSGTYREEFERRGLSDVDIKKSYLDIPEPQLHSVSDAKTLAKDVYFKASDGKNFLSFDDFNSIFPNPQSALNAFLYFDNGIDKFITMKTFHDTVLSFYMERVNLEKSISRAEEFVSIIGTFLNILVFCFLVLVYLIIFGIPLKELLALALSSALALNFIASGMATDLYYNFMMLLSHQFDIGDEIIVDNIEYKVHEFGLSSTSLLCENGGKVKFLNSDLWKKTLVNMTRAPEKILVFKLILNPDITNDQFSHFKLEIHNFLLKKKFDFYDTFSLQSVSEERTGINSLDCSLILKCKTFKNKTRKFYLRVETTNFLRRIIDKYELASNK